MWAGAHPRPGGLTHLILAAWCWHVQDTREVGEMRVRTDKEKKENWRNFLPASALRELWVRHANEIDSSF